MKLTCLVLFNIGGGWCMYTERLCFTSSNDFNTGVFHKIFGGEGLAFGDDFSVHVRDGVRWGGNSSQGRSQMIVMGDLENLSTEAKSAPLQQNQNKFWCFKRKIELSIKKKVQVLKFLRMPSEMGPLYEVRCHRQWSLPWASILLSPQTLGNNFSTFGKNFWGKKERKENSKQ